MKVEKLIGVWYNLLGAKEKQAARSGICFSCE